jgi:hypothetical protein
MQHSKVVAENSKVENNGVSGANTMTPKTAYPKKSGRTPKAKMPNLGNDLHIASTKK